MSYLVLSGLGGKAGMTILGFGIVPERSFGIILKERAVRPHNKFFHATEWMDLLDILLTDFNKAQVLAKDAVNPKWQKDQKNRCNTERTALISLKRSGFVFINESLIL